MNRKAGLNRASRWCSDMGGAFFVKGAGGGSGGQRTVVRRAALFVWPGGVCRGLSKRVDVRRVSSSDIRGLTTAGPWFLESEFGPLV